MGIECILPSSHVKLHFALYILYGDDIAFEISHFQRDPLQITHSHFIILLSASFLSHIHISNVILHTSYF